MDRYSAYAGRGTKYEPYPGEYEYPSVFRSKEYDDQISGSYDPRSKMSKSEDSGSESVQKGSLKTVCGEFAEMTSVQGLIFIAHANRIWKKLLWLIVFLGSCAAMIFHLTYLSNVFFLFPKQSKIELGFDGLSFPAITLCNINPIRASMLNESGAMMEILMEASGTANQIKHLTGTGNTGSPSETTNQPTGTNTNNQPNGTNSNDQQAGTNINNVNTNNTGQPAENRNGNTNNGNTNNGNTNNENDNIEPSVTNTNTNVTQNSTTTNTNNKPTGTNPSGTQGAPNTGGAKRRRKRYLDDLSMNYTNTYSEYTDDWDGFDDKWAKQASRTTEAKMDEEFTALFSDMKRNKRVRLGHQLKNFMIQSSFSGRGVPNNNYKTLQSMTYGNCFSLQYSDFISRKGGPTDGYEAILFLENDEYIHGWTNGNGAHLVLHDIDTLPLIEKDGIAISGGTETFIGIKRVNIGRLGKPHGECDDGSNFREQFNLTYTRQACQDYCQVRLFADQCNCTDGRLDELNRMFKFNDTHRECRSNSEIKCLIQWQRKYQFGDYTSSCTCISPCTETRFEKSVSSRQWPSVEYGTVLVQAICARSNDEHCNKLKGYDGFRLSHNFIKLNIYYEDLNYENITEAEDYETAQYLSDIGGTLGLWIGLSAVSIFEIGQLICQCCGVCCRSRNKRSDKRVEPRMRRDHVLPDRVAYMTNPKAGYPQSDLGSYQLNRRH